MAKELSINERIEMRLAKVKRYGNISLMRRQSFRVLARNSKMDCWFSVDDNGFCRDLENGDRLTSARKCVYDLIDGMTHDDWESLTDENKLDIVYTLHQLMGRGDRKK